MAKFRCIKKCYKNRVFEVGDELELHNGTKTPAHFEKITSIRKKTVKLKPREPNTYSELTKEFAKEIK